MGEAEQENLRWNPSTFRARSCSGKYTIPGVKSFDDIGGISAEIRGAHDDIIDVSVISDPEIRNMLAMASVDGNLIPGDPFRRPVNAPGAGEASYEPESLSGSIRKTKFGTANICRGGKAVLLRTNNLTAPMDLNEHIQLTLSDSGSLF